MRRMGSVLFWVGATYVFVGSWLVMWWVAPMWRDTPTEHFEGTLFAFAGPVFMAIALSMPVGLLLAAVGTFMRSATDGERKRSLAIVAAGTFVMALSILFPSEAGFAPVLFGVGGGLILILFFGALWLWAGNRRHLSGRARLAADLQLVSYLFFILPPVLCCSLLGNPFSGLLFPEKVIATQSLPWHYAVASKVVIYFVLGWGFSFASQYVLHTSRSAARQSTEPAAPVGGPLPHAGPAE